MSELQVVHIRVNDAVTNLPTPVCVRFASNGQYYPPFGRLQDIPSDRGRDVGGNLLLDKEFAYIDGMCEVPLPDGPIDVEITKGPEYTPIQARWIRPRGKISQRYAIEPRTDARQKSWVTGDTRAFHLSPRAACLEGAAEGLDIVNVLAAQWENGPDRTISNILDFSGQSPAWTEYGCMAVVNTFNQHADLGNLSLLNCHRPVFPLSFSNTEFSHWTLQDWAEQCHRKTGLVLWPDFPLRPGERLVNLINGHIDAIEVESLDRHTLEDWYGLLNCGLRVPIVAGSGKAGTGKRLGSPRTYALVGDVGALDYRAWVEAVRTGRTCISDGPLLSFQADGQHPGTAIRINTAAPIFKFRLMADSHGAIEKTEIVLNGTVVAENTAEGEIQVSTSGWAAARGWGTDGLVAHTSPIYLKHPTSMPIAKNVKKPILQQLDEIRVWAETALTGVDSQENLLTAIATAQEKMVDKLSFD